MERSRIDGVGFHPLDAHPDPRGVLVEIHRDEWALPVAPVQWNAVRSRPGVLRGVHCHVHHADLLNVVAGELVLGIVDLRTTSPTFRVAEIHRIPALTCSISIAPGIAHGFLFEVESIMVYGVDVVWNVDDELGCRWDDPGLGLDWPIDDPDLSERDRAAGSLDELIALVDARL